MIVRLMVGRDLADFFPPPGDPVKFGPVVLSVQDAGNAILSDIELDLCAGEIVGVAGLEGSGKGALGLALFGDERRQFVEIEQQREHAVTQLVLARAMAHVQDVAGIYC